MPTYAGRVNPARETLGVQHPVGGGIDIQRALTLVNPAVATTAEREPLRAQLVPVQRQERWKIVLVVLAAFSFLAQFFMFFRNLAKASSPRVKMVAPVDEEIRRNYHALLPEVEDLRYKIALFDEFVKTNHELNRLFLQKHQEFGQYIVRADEDPLPPATAPLIERLGALRLLKVTLEHQYGERFRFISTHPELKESFLEHMRRMQAEGRSRPTSPPVIEEITIAEVD